MNAPTAFGRLHRALITVVLVATVTMTPGVALAQCGAPVETDEAIRSAITVFVGRVVSTDNNGRIAEMEVLSIWKGRNLPTTVEVRGAPSADSPAASTDRRFDFGATYLVVPENTREPYLATTCSATSAFAGPANLVPQPYQDAVGSDTGRAAAAGAPSTTAADERALVSSIVPLVGLIALIGLVWALIVFLRTKEPERQRPTEADDSPAQPAPRKRRFRHRELAKDIGHGPTAADRVIKRNRRRWKAFRRRQDRDLAAVSSRTASGSTDTS